MDTEVSRVDHGWRSASVFRVCAALAMVMLLAAGSAACTNSAYSRADLVEARDGEPDVDGRAIRNLGCVDVGFGLKYVGAPGGVPLLRVRFGNRCEAPATFDLGRLEVTGFTKVGAPRRLAFVDPRDEIRPLAIDASGQGIEKIQLADPAEGEARIERICLDARRVAPDGPPMSPQPVCFVTSDDSEWKVAP